MFDLHLFPAASREEYLMDTFTIICVHDCDGTPISAYPQGVPPDSETGDSEEGAVVRYRDLHLGVSHDYHMISELNVWLLKELCHVIVMWPAEIQVWRQ